MKYKCFSNLKETVMYSLGVLFCLSLSVTLNHGIVPFYGEYYKPGDLIIGVYLPLSLKCSEVHMKVRFLRVIGVVKGFELAQANPNYVFRQHNISLGYYIMDTCYDEQRVFGSMRFIGPIDISTRDACNNYVAGQIYRCLAKSSLVDVNNFYSLAGVIGPSYSNLALNMAEFLQNFHVPQITPHATTDQLTDKKKFPFLLRMVASDKFQALALVDILLELRIPRIAIIYKSDSYGSHLLKLLKHEIKMYNICVSLEMDLRNSIAYEINLAQLIKSRYYLTHIVYISKWDNMFLDAVENYGFIFITSDAAYSMSTYFTNATRNALSVGLGNKRDTVVSDIYNNLTRDSAIKYPFGYEFWERSNDCSFNGRINLLGELVNRSCADMSGSLSRQQDFKNGDIYLDVVDIFARALTKYTRQKCQRFLLANPKNISWCIVGKELFQVIRNVKFEGISQKVSFNEAGDSEPYYAVYQQTRIDKVENVGNWTRRSGLHLKNYVVQYYRDRSKTEEHCSKRCSTNQVIKVIINCCKICLDCLENEIPSADRYRCQACPISQWPTMVDNVYNYSSSTILVCRSFESTHIHPGIFEGVLCYSLSAIGVGSTAAVLTMFVRYRDRQVLKASSLALSCLALVGQILVHISIISFVGNPNSIQCRLQTISCNCSLGLVYNCILVKTYRIHRLFTLAARGVKKIRFTSNTFVIILTVLFTTIDIFLITGIQFSRKYKPSANTINGYKDRRQPIRNRKYTEEKCITDELTLWIPLSWNTLKLVVCCLLAWFCYHLPNNFHDSRYILIFSSGSIFLWITFVPALLATSSPLMQALLIYLAYFISAMLVLATCFVPKLFSLYQNINHPCEDNILTQCEKSNKPSTLSEINKT